MTLTNDVAEPSPVVNLTSADVTLDTDGRDRSFKPKLFSFCCCFLTDSCKYDGHFIYMNILFIPDVLKGEYSGKKVAIKCLKDSSKAAQQFLAEASVMT